MFLPNSEMKREPKVELRGGKGTLTLTHIVPPEMLHGAGTQLGIITIPVGCSIGVHAHTENFETYYILKGTGRVTDGGEERILCPGEAEMADCGNTHSIENIGDCDLEMLAVILNNFDAKSGLE